MTSYQRLIDGNRRWAAERRREDPAFFERQAEAHRPTSMFIGCSDARVPADMITATEPGEIFVARNIANQFLPTDGNVQAVLQYAVNVLEVKDIIVCGHEGCGGVRAALEVRADAHLEGWLANIRQVARLHRDELTAIDDFDARCLRLVELNVAEQVRHLAASPVVQRVWEKGGELRLHGWMYQLRRGLIKDLAITMDHSMPMPDVLADPADDGILSDVFVRGDAMDAGDTAADAAHARAGDTERRAQPGTVGSAATATA